MEHFIESFCKKYNTTEKDCRKLIDIMDVVNYKKGDFLVREGEINNSYYIIKEGIWRGYIIRDGEELSVWFATTGETVFSSWGYMANCPSPIFIEAMTDSTLFCISKQRMDEFLNSSVECANMGRRLVEQDFLAVEEKIAVSGSIFQAKERYLDLLRRDPHLLQHVPLKHIASYLYITPQSLSRIRAELAREK